MGFDCRDPFWLLNFYWLFWLGLSFALAIILGFLILRPVVFNKFFPTAPDSPQGWGY